MIIDLFSVPVRFMLAEITLAMPACKHYFYFMSKHKASTTERPDENDGKTKVSIHAKGGNARAASLSSDARSEIARRAALSRWTVAHYDGPIYEAEFPGVLNIGDKMIPCAVLSDGRRVLSDNGITNAILGSRSGASKRLKQAAKTEGAHLPLFLAPSNLNPFISEELKDGPLKPIVYQSGNRTMVGYDAELLPAVCDVWLQARQAGALQSQQLEKAQQAEILMRGLAKIGIIALVDEATGYQEIRDRVALQVILDKYLKDEWSKWTRRFPSDFYKELFRLKGVSFPNATKNQKPGYVGHWTNDIVYSRLTPGLLKKLKELNPRNEKGNRARKHHQHFTEEIGVPELQQHISNVVFLMKTCATDIEFKRKLDMAAPKQGDTLQLPLEL